MIQHNTNQKDPIAEGHSAGNAPWYVMCHLSPQTIETMLQKDCDGKFLAEGEEPLPPFRFFVPFQSIPVIHAPKSAQKENTSDKHYRPQDDQNALRYDLHNFVFIQAPAWRVEAIVKSKWNTNARLRLYHYRDTNQKVVTVSDAEMRQLMATIQSKHLQFYIDQPLDDFAPGDRVTLKLEPWEGRHGIIKQIAIRRGQLCMTISMNILGRTKSINFTDVHVGDILFEDKERGRMLSDNPIANYEEEILDLLSHRFGHSHTEEMPEADRLRLKRLSTYNHIYVDDADERMRFASLKLICAYLLQNHKKRETYQQEVVDLLGNKLTPTIDAEAYLMIALFITTRQVHWRDAVKEYRNTHPDALPSIRRFFATIRNLKAKKTKNRNHGSNSKF